jgi:hypothetical protein
VIAISGRRQSSRHRERDMELDRIDLPASQRIDARPLRRSVVEFIEDRADTPRRLRTSW